MQIWLEYFYQGTVLTEPAEPQSATRMPIALSDMHAIAKADSLDRQAFSVQQLKVSSCSCSSL